MEKYTFLQKKKSTKKHFSENYRKKSHECEKEHKRAHVLFKSTMYDPCNTDVKCIIDIVQT